MEYVLPLTKIMDMYVEKQCVKNLRDGDVSQFIMLFNANFELLYRYVARRKDDTAEIEKLVNLVFIDALGNVNVVPTDVSFAVWLFTFAHKRIWNNLSAGVGVNPLPFFGDESLQNDSFEILERAKKVLGKLTMEEREIVRLKFFEQVSDGDVSYVLQIEEGGVGAKIYRVLKRVHFLLFGEADDRKEIYFGEVSAFFGRIKEFTDVEVPEVLKLTLRAELSSRIDRKQFAIEGEDVSSIPKPPVKEKVKRSFVTTLDEVDASEGSNDPAKIFVDAVREMRDEPSVASDAPNTLEFDDKMEGIMEFFDKVKGFLVAIPVLLFIFVVGFVGFQLFDRGIYRGYSTSCGIEVDFSGKFSDAEKRSFNEQVTNGLCELFEVKGLLVKDNKDGGVAVSVDLDGSNIEYRFVRNNNLWRVKKYARTFNSDEQSG